MDSEVGNAVWYYVVRLVVVPQFRIRAAEWEQARTALRDHVGREPTSEEVAERLGVGAQSSGGA